MTSLRTPTPHLPQAAAPSADAKDVAVLIGRFQPFHNAHLALLQEALRRAPQCVVVIGSAHQARTPKNPFSWTERAQMITQALPEADRARLRFLPVRDHYNEARWLQAVRDGVTAMTAAATTDSIAIAKPPRIQLVGHFKDATSGYLAGFPGWQLHAVERLPIAGGTELRDALFASDPAQPDATLAALVDQAPPTTLAFLRAWMQLKHFANMATEWRMLRDYHHAWAASPYPPVFVTVDAIVRCANHVLLIRRGQAPGVGLYAVPGGFIEQRETVYQSAVRELLEETQLAVLPETLRVSLQAVAVFDHPDRSQRGRTITHAHYFDLGDRDLPEVRAGDDAQSVRWTPLSQLTGMEDQFHDDHFHMLNHFLNLTAG